VATRIAVINKASSSNSILSDLYDMPPNMFVAGFIGSPAMNFFPATLRKEDGRLVVDADSFAVKIPEDRNAIYRDYVDKRVVFGIRPEDIHNPDFLPTNIHTDSVECKVDVTELMGTEIFLYLVTGSNNFVARVDPRTAFRTGDQANLAFNMDNFHIFDPDTEQAVR
jgi:multiple sugar transport system ATP-binding protein